MRYKNIVIEQEIFVMHDLHKALIELPAIQALELVYSVDNIIALEVRTNFLNSLKAWAPYQASIQFT